MGLTFTILIAEDDPNDLLFMRRAIAKCKPTAALQCVADGEELVAYLKASGVYANRNVYPRPDLLLLDLKMPRKTGFEVLEWLQPRRDERFVPTIVVSSSEDPGDVSRAYALGAHGYFTKKLQMPEFDNVVRAILSYWHLAEKTRQ